ncbi:hypothetical protein JCM19233_4175 [Vibrio astriarenae]|nr:hypothetical protein JCM19233_4175 [Vibrio sp. C7]
MRHFIPEDAKHMPSAEWLNYYVVRENVLMIGLVLQPAYRFWLD